MASAHPEQDAAQHGEDAEETPTDQSDNEEWSDEEEDDDMEADSELEQLLGRAGQLEISARPFLKNALEAVEEIVDIDFKPAALQQELHARCEQSLRFLITVAEHEAFRDANRPHPASIENILLLDVTERVQEITKGAATYADLSATQQDRNRQELLSSLKKAADQLQSSIDLYQEHVGLPASDDNHLPGSSSSPKAILATDDRIRQLIADRIEASWLGLSCDASEPPDLQLLRLLYEALNAIGSTSGTDQRYGRDPSDLDFKDERQACAWKVAFQHQSPLREELIKAKNANGPEFHAKLTQYSAGLCRAGAPGEATLLLVFSAASAREQSSVQPKDPAHSLRLGMCLAAAAVVQEDDLVDSLLDIASAAVNAIRPLYSSKPEQYARAMATALLALARVDPEELESEEINSIRDAAKEAIKLYSQLSASSPDDLSLRHGQACAHRALGDVYTELEEEEDGIAEYQSGLQIYRQLAAQGPPRFKLSLVDMLTYCSMILDPARKDPSPSDLTDEAAAILQGARDAWPTLAVPQLYQLNLNKAIILSDQGRLDDAEQAAEQSYTDFTEYSKAFKSPEPELLGVIHLIRASIQIAAEKYDEALQSCSAAEQVYSKMDTATRQSFVNLHASVLTQRGFVEWMLGKTKEALNTLQRAVRLLTAARDDDEAEWQEELASALTYLCGVHCTMRNMTKALRTATDAIKEAREAYEEEGAKSAAHVLAMALVFCAGANVIHGGFKKAADAAAEAVQLMTDHGTYEGKVKTALQVQARALEGLGRNKEAKAARAKADLISGKGFGDMFTKSGWSH